ncbi:P-loop containing nucleoside triphosphate hydrolase protein, partial [Lactarius tabidus]
MRTARHADVSAKAPRAFSEQWTSMEYVSCTIANSHPFALRALVLRDSVLVLEDGERVNVVLRRPAGLADLEQDEELEVGRHSRVLDEADTLLDMGFCPDIDAITDFFPKTPIRQTFLFSATVSPQIRQVARKVIDKDHLFIDVVSKDTSPVHAHIPQHYTVLPNAKEQLPQLLRLIAHDQLANPRSSKVIVFLNITKQTQLFATLFRQLSKTTLPARSQIYEIHLKRTQASQTAASNMFHCNRSGAAILVGIPASLEQYIHRVGRTGSSGKSGRADLLLLPLEQTSTLAEKFESDSAGSQNSAEVVKPYASKFPTKERHFYSDPSATLANLDTEIAGQVDQFDREAIAEVVTDA